MVTRSRSPLDQTSGLTDTTTPPITSSFTVTYSGSGGGGGGHGHGHGPNQTLGQLVAPVQADHLVSHIDLNVPLPLCVRNAKELGPQHSTLGADNRILDVGHAPPEIQRVFPALHDPAERFNAVVDVLCDRFALLLSEHQHLMNASTGG